jgi:hypothetical protein
LNLHVSSLKLFALLWVHNNRLSAIRQQRSDFSIKKIGFFAQICFVKQNPLSSAKKGAQKHSEGVSMESGLVAATSKAISGLFRAVFAGGGGWPLAAKACKKGRAKVSLAFVIHKISHRRG